MVALNASGAGAAVGLLIGISLSVYVWRLDSRKRREGTRTRAEYRGSLVLAPILLAGLGALIAAGIAHLF